MHSQVILRGKPYGDFGAREYREQITPIALEVVKECLAELVAENDVIIIEGAGSPAEINLKANDIANMRIADLANAPVLLVGDIDRGGCLASIVGTLELLTPEERDRVKGLIINKFRGDLSLLQPGLDFLEQRTGIPVLGVLPYLQLDLPEEDSMGLPCRIERANDESKVRIGVVRLPRVSNFTDFDAFRCEDDVELCFIGSPQELQNLDMIVLPGTKNTTSDLQWLNQTGLSSAIVELANRTLVFGICGGYQMLGQEVLDPGHSESNVEHITGLGLLPIVTKFRAENKTLRQVQGVWYSDVGHEVKVTGYEIHQGNSENYSSDYLFQTSSGYGEGCRYGNVMGTYWHGCFDGDAFRREFLNQIRRHKNAPLQDQAVSFQTIREESYRKLAESIRQNLNLAEICNIMEQDYVSS